MKRALLCSLPVREEDICSNYHIDAFIYDKPQHNEFLLRRDVETEISFWLCALLKRVAKYVF